MPELAVILVNYRRPHDTIECISSLRLSTYADFDIVLIDNASHDGSVEAILARFPDLHVIRHEQNLGFAGGNNAGLRLSLRERYRFFLLLNNDTVVDASLLGALVSTAHRRPDAGVIGAKIYFHDRPDHLWFAGGLYNKRSGAVSHRGMNEQDTGRYDTLSTCDYVTGCCLLIRREVLERVGLLDESLFAYYEDCDYSLRTRAARFAVLYQPTARLWHKVSSTAQWDSPLYHYFTLRNRLMLLRKHSTFAAIFPGLPLLIYSYGRQFLRLAIRIRSTRCLRAAWMGTIDGLRGFAGEHGRGRMDQVL